MGGIFDLSIILLHAANLIYFVAFTRQSFTKLHITYLLFQSFRHGQRYVGPSIIRSVTIELRHHYNFNSINLESIHAQYPPPPVTMALGSMSM